MIDRYIERQIDRRKKTARKANKYIKIRKLDKMKDESKLERHTERQIDRYIGRVK